MPDDVPPPVNVPPPFNDEPPPPDDPPSRRDWGDRAKQQVRPTSTAPSTPDESVDEAYEVSQDDQSLDESGVSASDLVIKELGGEVIEEG